MKALNKLNEKELIKMATEKIWKENKNKFNNEQLSQIKKGINSGLDFSIYAKPEFTAEQMRQIRRGLIRNLNVSWYDKPEFK